MTDKDEKEEVVTEPEEEFETRDGIRYRIFRNDEANASFQVRERPTVRQQLAYIGKVTSTPDGMLFLRWWNGALDLIEKWECDIFPDHKTDLDKVTNPKVTSLLIWAGLQVQNLMGGLDEIEKN